MYNIEIYIKPLEIENKNLIQELQIYDCCDQSFIKQNNIVY